MNLPGAAVQKIIKDALPDGIGVGKDARIAISKAATVFGELKMCPKLKLHDSCVDQLPLLFISSLFDVNLINRCQSPQSQIENINA